MYNINTMNTMKTTSLIIITIMCSICAFVMLDNYSRNQRIDIEHKLTDIRVLYKSYVEELTCAEAVKARCELQLSTPFDLDDTEQKNEIETRLNVANDLIYINKTKIEELEYQAASLERKLK